MCGGRWEFGKEKFLFFMYIKTKTIDIVNSPDMVDCNVLDGSLSNQIIEVTQWNDIERKQKTWVQHLRQHIINRINPKSYMRLVFLNLTNEDSNFDEISETIICGKKLI